MQSIVRDYRVYKARYELKPEKKFMLGYMPEGMRKGLPFTVPLNEGEGKCTEEEYQVAEIRCDEFQNARKIRKVEDDKIEIWRIVTNEEYKKEERNRKTCRDNEKKQEIMLL